MVHECCSRCRYPRSTRIGVVPGKNSSPSASRSVLVWSLGLGSLGLILRLSHLATIQDSPFYRHLFLDLRFYDDWALRIAGGEWLGEQAFFQDPLYAYAVAVIYKILGHHHFPVVLLQALLGALIPLALYRVSRRSLGETAARVGALVAVCYPPSLYYEGLLLKTSLAMALVTAALLLLMLARDQRRVSTALVAGCVLGLACLIRGNLLLFVPFAVAWLLLERDDGASATPRWRRPERLRLAGAVAMACLALIAGTAARNRWVGGEWILTTSNAGQNFYLGNNPLNTTGEYAFLSFVSANPKHEERDFAREAERRVGRALSSRQVSSYWFGEAGRWMRDRPGAWLSLMVRKFRVFWEAYEVPDNLDYGLYREHAPLLRLPLPGFGLLAPVGLLGLALLLRRPGWPRLLTLFVGAYTASVVLFFVFSRFRMPLVPALCVFAGYGAVELARRLRGIRTAQGRTVGATWPIFLFVLLFAFVNLPVRAVEGSWSLQVARSLGLPHRSESAAIAHFNLGVVYAAEASEADDSSHWLVLAEERLRAAVERDPQQATIHAELAKVLSRQERPAEAAAAFERASVLEPGNFRHLHGLGRMLRKTGDRRAAERAFRDALAVEPRAAASATQLGELLLEEGRRDEAAEAFSHALRHAPGNERAHEGLRRAGSDP